MSTVSLDKQKISELSAELRLTVNWDDNTEHLNDLINRYAPFIEMAACWSQPGEYQFITKGSEALFGEYFKDIKRPDMVQSRELIPLENTQFEDTYAISVSLSPSYLGMLLVKLNKDALELDLDNIKELVRVILPQLSLARYATVMAEEVDKRTSTDKQTGLWNRTYFNERFREECSRVSKTKEQGAIGILALDELAAMAKVMSSDEHNDLLVKASTIIKNSVRQTDWTVYWDKHEVLIYLTNTQSEMAVEVMTRISNQLVESHALLQPLVGLCSTIETSSARALIQLASRRLDLSRKDGRKTVACFATREGLKFVQMINSEL